jgi:hypothetical protein
MLDIIQNENDRLQQKKQLMDNATEQQQHVMVLNDTYRKKYNEYTKIVIVVVICTSIFVGIQMLVQYLDFPFWVALLAHVLNILVGFIVVTTIYATIQSRDNIDFDKLYVPPPKLDKNGNIISAPGSAPAVSSLFGIGCIGEECCDTNNGTVWNSNRGLCMAKEDVPAQPILVAKPKPALSASAPIQNQAPTLPKAAANPSLQSMTSGLDTAASLASALGKSLLPGQEQFTPYCNTQPEIPFLDTTNLLLPRHGEKLTTNGLEPFELYGAY